MKLSQYPDIPKDSPFSSYHTLVKQGILGDCAFLCVLQHLINQPGFNLLSLIRKLPSPNRTPGQPFIYEITLHPHKNHPLKIKIDSSIPCHPIRKTPIFASGISKSKHLAYVPGLIEKAYAQLRGGYASINSGTYKQAFSILGFDIVSSHYLNTNDDIDTHIHRISHALSNNAIIGCGTISHAAIDSRPHATGHNGSDSTGVRPSHAYMIRGVDGMAVCVTSTNMAIVWLTRGQLAAWIHSYQICYYHDNYSYSAQNYFGNQSVTKV